MMFASFHSNGTTPSFNDKLNTLASGILICSTVSISNFGGIPSTPGDLLSFIAFIFLATNSGVYVSRKQKVRDKVIPLEDNRGNIISDGLQMAEVLNEHFSSVLTTKDISSIPFPSTKFEGDKSYHLGQLFVTPEIIAKTIK